MISSGLAFEEGMLLAGGVGSGWPGLAAVEEPTIPLVYGRPHLADSRILLPGGKDGLVLTIGIPEGAGFTYLAEVKEGLSVWL